MGRKTKDSKGRKERADKRRFIPPTAHEAMLHRVPPLKEVVPQAVQWVRDQPGWDETRTMSREEPQNNTVIKEAVETYALAKYHIRGATEEQAAYSANLLGTHLFYMVNLELHKRKIFWVDESLAWMLAMTKLDIEGQCLRLPFPCCAFVFTDPQTLKLGADLKRHDDDPTLRQKLLQIITAYLTQIPAPDEVLGYHVSLLLDDGGDGWPYLVTRDLFVRPRDNLDAILDSHFPDVDPSELDPLFAAPELKSLLHLLINAVLYATTAHLDPMIIHSPLSELKRQMQGKGPTKQAKLRRRMERMTPTTSSEKVFHLPGKIEISRIRELASLENNSTGRTLMKRFMVRGHWRKANPSWKDQNVRWIEPFWKGPELATVIEREYRMKP